MLHLWLTQTLTSQTTGWGRTQDLQKNPYDQELHSALVSGYRESAALKKLRSAREEAASLVTWRIALEISVMGFQPIPVVAKHLCIGFSTDLPF